MTIVAEEAEVNPPKPKQMEAAMPVVLNEPTMLNDFLRWEVNPNFSRKSVVVGAPTEALTKGTVVGQKGDKWFPAMIDADMTKSVPAQGVLLYDVPAGADVATTILVRTSIVIDKGLIWHKSFNSPSLISNALIELEKAGIITATAL